jgi:hypothetical protein
MKSLRASLLLALLTLGVIAPAQAEVWRGQYGVAKTFNFKLYNADGTLDVDEADGGTEVSISCDQGAETTATNDFVDEGTFYSIAVTAAEMRCRNIAIVIAATTSEVFFVQTDQTPGVIAEGTAQAATGTTLQLAAAEAFADDEIIGATCIVTSASTGVGQARTITDYVSATDTATVATWTTTPTGTIIYQCHGTAAVTSSGSVSIAAGGITAASFAAGAVDAAAIAANAIGASEVADAAIDAATFASDAITAAKLASDVTTELQSGLATAAALSTVDDFLDTEMAAVLAAVDTEVAAIKAKTDNMLFTLTNYLQVDAQYMNGVEILGAGTTANPWNGE